MDTENSNIVAYRRGLIRAVAFMNQEQREQLLKETPFGDPAWGAILGATMAAKLRENLPGDNNDSI